MEILTNWNSCLNDANKTLTTFIGDPEQLDNCKRFSELLIESVKKGANIFTCGNGGSHCDAMHFAEELTGRYRKDRRPLGALALGDPSHVTCVGNDYGFEYIFSRQIEGLARGGDVLIGISTSGKSENVILAIDAAKKKGMSTVALLGNDGGLIKNKVDIPIVVPATTSDRIQEVHIKIIHIVIETLERHLFPENYV
jgi:D-sedoheptulose 7-phosphate isomerase